jgi:hypothetical protein
MTGVELRIDFDEDDPAVAVIDAIAHGEAGESRTSIVRRWLRERAEIELRRAQRIVRVTGTGRNPDAPDSDRKKGG